jgi:hypothetical protein
MTIRLLRTWNGYPANVVVTLDNATEAALVRDFTATTNLTGGVQYVQNGLLDSEPLRSYGTKTAAEEFGANPSAAPAVNAAAIQNAINSGAPAELAKPGTYQLNARPIVADGQSLDIAKGVELTGWGETVKGPAVLAGGTTGFAWYSMYSDEWNYLATRGGPSIPIKPGYYGPTGSAEPLIIGKAASFQPTARAIGLNCIASGQGLVVGDDTSVPDVLSDNEVYILASHSQVYGNGPVYAIGDAIFAEFDAATSNPLILIGNTLDLGKMGRGGAFGHTILCDGPSTATGGAFLAYGRTLRFTLTDTFNWVVFGQEYRIGATTKITLPAGRGGVIVGHGAGAGATRNEIDFGSDGLSRYRGTALRPETNGVGRLGNNAAGWGALFMDYTNTTPGTTGNQTINKPSGRVNIAAAGTSVVVTNSLVTAASNVMAMVCNGAAIAVQRVVPAAGSFTIHLDGVAPSETAVAFFVVGAD